ncbi:hypothetical protein JKP88DRAFT_156153, partial [Tribonema minus]
RRHRHVLQRQFSEASSPPPEVLRGLNMEGVSLDKRSWLEVRDPQHRYGKLLRLYYSEWDRLGKPGNSFFRWLEQREEGVEGCAREELDRDTVRY